MQNGFMDGIDGISGVTVIIIGLGVNALYFILEGEFDHDDLWEDWQKNEKHEEIVIEV